MIALPFHPSNAYTIREFKENMDRPAPSGGSRRARSSWASQAPPPSPTRSWTARFHVDQGGHRWLLRRHLPEPASGRRDPGGRLHLGSDAFWLSVLSRLHARHAGADQAGLHLPISWPPGPSVRSCFCGPCFGAGDVPANGGVLHPPLHPQLPQPGRLQARRRSGVLCGPDGRPVHCRHC